MITYNHEAFLDEAIQSILKQKTDFKFEIVIGEDCSKDRTAAILKKYEDQFPDLFKVLYHSPNKGMMENFKDTISRCHGQYIALLEGDDFWIDNQKLQKQIDLLDNHTNKSFCFHDVIIKEGVNDGTTHPHLEKQSFLEGIDLIDQTGSLAQTCSVVFRKSALESFPQWFDKMPVADWPLQYILSAFGPAIYHPEPMAKYRIHDGGIWSRKHYSDAWKENHKIYKLFSDHVRSKNEKIRMMQRVKTHIISSLNHSIDYADKVSTQFWLLELLKLKKKSMKDFKTILRSLMWLLKMRKNHS